MKESIINVQNLRNAWKVVRSKDSSGGADGINIQDYGRNSGRNLERLSKLLKVNGSLAHTLTLKFRSQVVMSG